MAWCACSCLRCGFPIGAGGYPHGGVKGSAEGAVIVKAALMGDFGDAQAGLAQEPRGSGQAGLGEELAGGEVEEPADESGESGWR